MNTKIKIALVTILTALLVFVGVSAANATEVNAPCTYDNGGINPVNSKLKVTTDSDGRLVVRGELYNDGIARDWDWTMKHNGELSDSGSFTGNTVVLRTMINFSGIDNVRWIVENDAQTIHCEALIQYAG